MNAPAHLLITASAGSGKTHQLTSRLLRLLADGAPGRRILASTFTRKAAGEIRDRLIQRVARAASGDARALADLRAPHGLDRPAFSTEDARALLTTLTTGLGRQSVATLDSVLAGFAMAMAPELGLEGVRAIVDENNPQARRLRARALLAALHALEARAEDPGIGKLVLLDLLERLHHGEGKRSVLRTLDRALSIDLLGLYAEQPAKEAWSLGEPPGDTMDAAALAAWAAAAQQAAKDLPKTKSTGQVNGNIAKLWNGLIDKMADGEPEQVLAVKLAADCRANPLEVLSYKLPIEGEPLRLLQAATSHALAAAFHREQHRLDATWLLLSAFDHCHQDIKRRAGVLCFSDLPRLLADGPAADAGAFLGELAWRLDGRVEHLLLDEFQDTSRAQWKVLRTLADEMVSGAEGRSLMVVGDPKQAIYAWRGGCSELMGKVADDLAAQDPACLLTLAQSFRSSPVVLEAVNAVFARLALLPCLQEPPALLEAAAQFQTLFTPHTAAKAGLPGRVRLYETLAPETDDGKPTLADKREAHAAQVADHVEALAAENPHASIGILVRGKKEGAALLRLLGARGLPVRDEGGVAIGDHPAVAQMLALLRLAELPDDRAALAVAGHGPLAEWFADDAVAKVRRGLRRHGLAGFLLRMNPLLLPACDTLAARRLSQLADLATRLEASDPEAADKPASLAAFVASARVAEPGEGAVTVMTLHGSKGLEFDLVVLPDLDVRLDQSDARGQAAALRDDPTGPPVRILRRLKKDLQALTPQAAQTHAAQMRQDRYEDFCLLYVGMTRAKQGLDLLVAPMEEAKSGETPASFARILREALDGGIGFQPMGSAGFQPAGQEPRAQDGRETHRQDADATSTLRLLHARGDAALALGAAEAEPAEAPRPLRLQWQKSAAPPRFLTPATPSGQAQVEASAADLLAHAAPTPGMVFGSAVHAVCERLGFIDEETWDHGALQQAIRDAGAADAPAVAAAVRRLLDGPGARWLARDGAADLRREWPFLLQTESELVSGIFDRVHLWRNDAGQVVRARILDFKTDAQEGTSATERAAHHAPQLRAYRAALARLTGCAEKAIACVLLFTADGSAAEVD